MCRRTEVSRCWVGLRKDEGGMREATYFCIIYSDSFDDWWVSCS